MKQYISVQELYRQLEGNVSMRTLYRMLQRGKIAGVRPFGGTGKWLVEEDAARAIINQAEATQDQTIDHAE